MTREERKVYDRVKKAEFRAKMTHQKKVREREKKYRENRTAKKKLILKQKTEEQMSETNSSPISPSM